MSQGNLEMIQRAFESYGQGDAATILQMTDPEVVVYAQAGLAQAGTYQGRESMAQYMRDWEDAWEEMEYEPEDWLEDDDAVIVIVRYQGRGKGSGIAVDDRFVWRFEISGDRITAWGIYASKDAALEAAGLSE
jgi:ketosteroid isomerase-like protein